MQVTQRAPKAIDTSSELNDLFRLTYTLETAKDMQWTYRLPGDREWSGRYAVALSDGVNGIYLSRTSLDAGFDDKGRQINPLTAHLTGNVDGVVALLNDCGWQARSAQDVSLPHQYLLMARQGASGKMISDGAAPGRLQSDRSFS